MRFFAFNKGMVKPFRIKEGDGSDKDLTGLTVKWNFKERDGTTSPTGNPITGNVTTPLEGKCEFQIPANFFKGAAKYNTQINITGGTLDEDTEPIVVDIDNPTNRTV